MLRRRMNIKQYLVTSRSPELSRRFSSFRLCRVTVIFEFLRALCFCQLLCHDVLTGSGGLMVRKSACRSRGRWFDPVSAHSKLGQISLISFCLCLSGETLKAVGPNACVSPTLGCLEYNYFRLEKCLPQ